MGLRLITFDLDDTLWEIRPTIIRADESVRQWLIDRVPDVQSRLESGALRDFRDQLLKAHPNLIHDLGALRRLVYESVIAHTGISKPEAAGLAVEALTLFLDKRHQVVYFEDALNTLALFRERFVLGALTNGNTDIRRLGLDDYFSFAYTAADIGIGKPHPDIFERALREAGVLANESLHIGDHPEHDIAGAAAVGMHTLYFSALSELHRDKEVGVQPTLTASSMQEVQQKVLAFADQISS